MGRDHRARCSEEEFIRLCKTMKPAEIAQHLNIATRKVYERRKAIEQRREISLSYQSDPEYSAIRSIRLDTGVVIVGSDAHYWPKTVPTMHRAMLELCKRLKPAVVVAGDDGYARLDGVAIRRMYATLLPMPYLRPCRGIAVDLDGPGRGPADDMILKVDASHALIFRSHSSEPTLKAQIVVSGSPKVLCISARLEYLVHPVLHGFQFFLHHWRLFPRNRRPPADSAKICHIAVSHHDSGIQLLA